MRKATHCACMKKMLTVVRITSQYADMEVDGLVMCVTSGRQNVDEVVQTVATHRFKVPFLFFTHARTLSLSLSLSVSPHFLYPLPHHSFTPSLSPPFTFLLPITPSHPHFLHPSPPSYPSPLHTLTFSTLHFPLTPSLINTLTYTQEHEHYLLSEGVSELPENHWGEDPFDNKTN